VHCSLRKEKGRKNTASFGFKKTTRKKKKGVMQEKNFEYFDYNGRGKKKNTVIASNTKAPKGEKKEKRTRRRKKTDFLCISGKGWGAKGEPDHVGGGGGGGGGGGVIDEEKRKRKAATAVLII